MSAALAVACSAAGDTGGAAFGGSGGAAGASPDASVSRGGTPGASGFPSAGGLGGGTAAGGAGGVPIGSGGVVGSGGVPVGATGGAPSGGVGTVVPPALTPVYRIPLRVHMALSNLTNADLGPILDEVNRIWLSEGGICFEIEVTNDETNPTDGFDFRYTAAPIAAAPTANGLTQGPHAIWSIDHPGLGSAPNPVQNPAARTTAHELGHALNLDHENPPPSNDCASPCYCVTLSLDCNDFLMRSGTKGFFLSDPEVQIARARAAQKTLPDTAPLACGAPVYNR
jgi:hypothetical protein